MKQIIYILILIILCSTVIGATVKGDVYSYELNLNKNSIVTVDTTPKQTFVAKDGSYAFELQAGTYEITAFERIENITTSSVKETVTIDKEGIYTVDLILFPLIEEEELTDLGLEDIYQKKTDYTEVIIGLIVVILLLIAAFFVHKKLKKATKKCIGEECVDDLADRVLDFIKKEDGRTTQKAIRKEFPMSEAKISLVLAELKHKNKIEKIKKGRGNIIILK